MTLDDILHSFEIREDDFRESTIAEALRTAFKAGELSDVGREIVYAEMDAFSFFEDASEWATGWGLYYGPSATIPQPDGGRIEIPSLGNITADTIEYWKRRAEACIHPLLKNRYADLVWELSRRVTGTSSSPEFARLAIDAAIDLSTRDAICQVTVFEKLERALRLAKSLNDTDRVARVKSTLIAYEERRGEDDKLGTWGRAFALLIQDLKVPLTALEEQCLVSGLEARLGRVSCDPHAAERAAELLATYYRAKSRMEDVRRVLRVSADAYVRIARQATGLVASSWIEDVVRRYESFGLKEEAAALQPMLRDVHLRARDELVKTSYTIEVSPDGLRELVDKITDGTLGESINRIAANFVVDCDAVRRRALDAAREAPIQALIARSLMDDEGRTAARIGSIDEDLDGHVAHNAAQEIVWQQIWLRASLERLLERHHPTVDQLCTHVFASPIFEPGQQPLVRSGIEYYFQGDVIGTAHVLVPQIEQAIRRIVMLAGGSHLKIMRNGGSHYRVLDDLIRDPATERVLGSRIVRYLRVLLTDQRGLNLRNAIAHGYMPAERFTPVVADRLVHAVFVLAYVHHQSDPGGTASVSSGAD